MILKYISLRANANQNIFVFFVLSYIIYVSISKLQT